MRCRYTANVLRDTPYLLRSWHPATRPVSMDSQQIPDWCGLTILAVKDGQPGDREGMVEFKAVYRNGFSTAVLHERSRFAFLKGCWYYRDGAIQETGNTGTVRPGRNEPCPCGSGRKYKKCCMQSK